VTTDVIRPSLTRLGTVMRADPHDPREREGVCNPAAARGGDGEFYLFPRIVAAGNYSRIARTRLRFHADVPVAVERLGVVLEPTESWERNSQTAGVEDPRITRLDELDVWVMCYAAYGPLGAKVAVAVSRDLVSWRRLGPVAFGYEPGLGADFTMFPNKDATFFPGVVRDPAGRPALAMLHRPFFRMSAMIAGAPTILPAGVDDDRESIWVSYVPVAEARADLRALTRLSGHQLVAAPKFAWESVKIGAGPPPIRTDAGWLLIHHGVRATDDGVEYAAGAMLLDHDDVSEVRWRSPEPLLRPETSDERSGAVPNVVFPTAVDATPTGRTLVYYGMADDKIGAALLDVDTPLQGLVTRPSPSRQAACAGD